MRVLLFSDLHGHAFKRNSVILPDGRNSRLQDAVMVLQEIYEACAKYKIDVVLFGGDLFHSRGTLQVSTFNAIYEGIARIKTRVNGFGMLVGNHDQATKHGDIHACYAFDSIVQVMDRGGWHCFEEEMPGATQLHVFAIPFTTEKKEVEDLLKLAEKTMPSHVHTCCLAHIGISGAKAGSNFVLVTKDNVTTIPFSQPGFDQVFLGHYHEPQMLAPNIRYMGATHHHNWGDVGQERGYWIWDTDDGDAAFVPVTAAPQFIMHDANELVTKESIAAKVDGNFVRVKFDQAPHPDDWKKALGDMEGARKVEQWVEPTVPTLVTPEDENKYQPGVDFEDMIESFVADSDCEELDRDLLIKIGKNILKGVQ